MIIEIILQGDEVIAHAEHVLSCSDKQCDDIAHLFDKLTARFAGLAEVFTFVAGMPRGHQYRLNHARLKERAQRDALPMQHQRSLEPFHQAWHEAERGCADPSA